jgi:hypothetical protein
LRLPYTLRWIGKVIFREADLSVYVRRPQTHRSGVYQTKKNYQEKNVIRKLFGVKARVCALPHPSKKLPFSFPGRAFVV